MALLIPKIVNSRLVQVMVNDCFQRKVVSIKTWGVAMPVGRSYLITGARGLLGREILEAVLQHNNPGEIFLGGRDITKMPNKEGSFFERLMLDMTKKIDLPEGIDTVIHAAGEKHDETLMEAVNYRGTEMLAKQAAMRGVRRFVHISSVGVYGATSATKEVSEDSPKQPRNAYERSKSLGEMAVLKIAEDAGMEAIILRPSTVLAVAPSNHYPLLGLIRSIKSGRFSWVHQHDPMSNFIGVFDVAAAVAYTSRMPIGECRSFILNTPLRLRDLVAHIAVTTGIPTPTRELPVVPIQVGAWLGDTIEILTGRSFPLSTDKLSQLMSNTRFSPERLAGSGFQYPHGILETVSLLIKRYRTEGLL